MAVNTSAPPGAGAGQRPDGGRQWASRRWRRLSAAAAAKPRLVTTGVVVGMAALLVLRVLTAVHRGAALSEGDVVRFHHLGVAHGRPYVDYLVEYPIFTLAIVKVMALFAPGAVTFGHVVVWSQFALDLAVAALLWRWWGRRAAIFYFVAGAPLVHLLYARLDLFATVAAVRALAL